MAPTPPSTRTAARPTPTDEELATRVRAAVTRLHRRLRQQSPAGLSPAQGSALATVDRLGTPTLGELAVAEQVQPPTMTRLVAGMEAAGLLERLSDAADGRVSRVRITAGGRRTIERIRSQKNAFLARRFSQFDEAERASLAELTVLLERLVAEE